MSGYPRAHSVRRFAIATALCTTIAVPAATTAQAARDTARAQSGPLVRASDLALAGGLLLGAAAISPFDGAIARASQRPALQQHQALHDVASTFNALGGPGAIVLPIAAWGIGRLSHDAPLAAAGVRVGEAVALGAVVTDVAKGLAGRARPYAVADTDPANFRLGHGFGDEARTSFPSGHSTAAWAAAGMLDSELRMYWPNAEHVAGPAAYAAASLVSLSRIYTDKHWASDVIAGAAVGSLAARVVARYHRAHSRSLVDRVFLQGGEAPPVRSATLAGPGVPIMTWSIAW